MSDEDTYGGELRKVKLGKLEKIKKLGIDPYPTKYDRTHYTVDIVEQFETLEKEQAAVAVAGRCTAIRKMGKAIFGHLRDFKGKIQIYVRKDKISEQQYELIGLIDIGDFLGVKGRIFRTKTGEITVAAEDIQLLAKTLLPLPIVKEEEIDGKTVTHDAFADKELRYRRRYLDLAVNPEVKEIFITRAKIVSSMRRYLENKGYIEVETPVLQPVYGGASARPFKTHHNVLDTDLYLRIADELYLKRLIAGGFEGVFEIAKDFRNEGIDRLHNPEFTMMELYVAYKNHEFMMEIAEDMIAAIAQEVTGSMKITYQGQKIDLTPPWERLKMTEAIKRYTGYNVDGAGLALLKKYADELEIETEPFWGPGKIIEEIFDEFVEKKITHPTFIIDYPSETSPLAKKNPSNPDIVERFEAIAAGFELANGYSELNDPQDQKQRFLDQMAKRRLGDEEAQVLDEDYIMALEYGMPPTTGIGVGIDRLSILLTDTNSLKDVILFPQMKPQDD
ncbi:lysyl-tRNA synthetase [bacterium SM23_31]|nr:MAG: lysyl-tRNA synthetase [bacterium SM23_31]